jgi:hypothetical protein
VRQDSLAEEPGFEPPVPLAKESISPAEREMPQRRKKGCLETASVSSSSSKESANFRFLARPKPVQKPHPPIHVGGAFPYGARRAIRYGDGWIPTKAARRA